MRDILKITALCALAACAGVAVAEASACGALETAADGYCDAYCEALDCDGAPEAGVDTCVAVFDAYKQDAGTAPPCEADLVCPCVDAMPAFANVVYAPNSISACASANGRRRAQANVEIQADVSALTCSVVHGNGTTETLSITYEEAGACLDRIEAAVAQAGQSCA